MSPVCPLVLNYAAMNPNMKAWMARADELLRSGVPHGELTAGATSMLTALYGPASPQLKQFLAGCAPCKGSAILLVHHSKGAIVNAKKELEAGLIVNLRVAVAGEILTEMARLAREVLQDGTEEAKNVSAVLVASAFEGTLRKMGGELAGVENRPKLETVITALKEAGVLKGAEVGICQSHLQFRNDSLHADWGNVSRTQVETCLALIESLVSRHFA